MVGVNVTQPPFCESPRVLGAKAASGSTFRPLRPGLRR